MKKAFLILIFSVVATAIGQTQAPITESFYRVRLGLQAGPNFSSWVGDYGKQYQSTINGLAGVSFEYRFNETVSFVTNINYDRKSFRYDYLLTPGPSDNLVRAYTRKLLFQSVNIPLMVRVYLDPDKMLYVNGGMFYNSVRDVSAKVDIQGRGTQTLQYDSLFRKEQLGCVLGIGYNFELSPSRSLSIELRDDYGFSGVLRDYNRTVADLNTVKFIVGYSFSCGRRDKVVDF